MARFDVFAISGSDQLVVDIQADILRDLHTRVVVPLMPVAAGRTEIAKRLRPIVTVGDCDYILNTPELAALPYARLGPRVTSLENQRETIIDAVDFLMQGF